MKRVTFLFLIFLLFSGCDNPYNTSSSTESYNEEENRTGKIEVRLGEEQFSSRALDSTTAQSNTDVYEVIAYNENTVASSIISPTQTSNEISVSPGDYKVLVLAGTKDDSISKAHLLGAGVSDTITVLQDETTPVTITVNPAPVEVTKVTTDTIYTGDTFTVSISADTGCNVLSLNGTAHWVYFDGVSKDANLSGQTSSDNITFTAPQTEGNHEVYYGGGYVHIADPSFNITALTVAVSKGFIYDWHFLGKNYLPTDNTELINEISKQITVEAAMTGLDVSITWS